MGGGHGAMTNIDGQFSLQVPAKVTKLRVSYVGYTTQEVAAGANITVKLHSTATDLDEVMVVAYGTAKKSAFTGSAAVVDASDIEKTQASNVPVCRPLTQPDSPAVAPPLSVCVVSHQSLQATLPLSLLTAHRSPVT
jgi:hypothetical protein